MQKPVLSHLRPRGRSGLSCLSAGLIVGIAMGLRQVMGLYLQPMTTELGIGREPFSTAMAVANLIWGIGAVAAGMVADRYGAGRVVVGGTLATMAGLYLMYAAHSAFDLMVSGVLLGIGVSGTGITALWARWGGPRRPTSARPPSLRWVWPAASAASSRFPIPIADGLAGWQASLWS